MDTSVISRHRFIICCKQLNEWYHVLQNIVYIINHLNHNSIMYMINECFL